MRFLALVLLLLLPSCGFLSSMFDQGDTTVSVPAGDASLIGQWATQDFYGFAGVLKPYDQVTDAELLLYLAWHGDRIRRAYAVAEPPAPIEEEKPEEK